MDHDVDHDLTDPRAVEERLALEVVDQRELVDRRVADLRRVLESGCSWRHPHTVAARSRLAAALTDLRALELLGAEPFPDESDD